MKRSRRPRGSDELTEVSLSAADVKQRAISGALLVGGRGIGVRLIALLGSVVLARLLTAEDFGLVALGATIVAFGVFLADGGLGAALIRRPEPPTRRELEALLGLQLSLTVALAGVAALVALPFGETGLVAVIMVASLPVFVLQLPGSIQLERRLSYGPQVLVELLEVLAFNVWAIIAVLLGYGVLGFASAFIARSVVGAVVMWVVVPQRVLRPRFDLRLIRSLLAFGLRYQAVGGVNLLREQGLNVMTALVAGVSTLGLWAVAQRVLQVPFLVFQALWRVSYPGIARLSATGEELAGVLRRTAQVASVATGALLVPLGATSPIVIEAVFGAQWASAGVALPPALVGMLIGGPVSVIASGYLYSRGDSQTILKAAVLHTIAWFAVAMPLLPRFGVFALGLGWAAASAVDVIVLVRRLRASLPTNVLTALLPPAAVALICGSSGYAVALSLPATLTSVLVVAATSATAYLLGLRLVASDALGASIHLLGRAVTRQHREGANIEGLAAKPDT